MPSPTTQRKVKKKTASARKAVIIDKTSSSAIFYDAVKRVPKGRVSTYGAIAVVAKKPRAARQVGFALGALRDPNTDIPWHRVLASKSPRHGAITPRGRGFAARQRQLLEAEGVEFDARGRVDLRLFGWPERAAAKPRKPSKAQRRS